MEYLIVIRAVSGVLGVFFAVRAFIQFRRHIIRRREFLFLLILGVGILAVSLYPDSINIVAGMMAMDDRQYGRLIALIIISNMLLWLLIIGLRNREGLKSMQFDLLIRKLAIERFFEKGTASSLSGITVIIPAFNEADNLNHVLPGIPESIDGHAVGVLVVDDGSSDNTADVAHKHGYSVASSPFNRGGGAALRLGYDIAMVAGAKIIVTMDADGQHLPGEIERLVQPILNSDKDIVLGSRVLGKREKDSITRLVGIHLFSFLINLLAGTRITDCSNGFRAFRMDALKNTLLIQDQFHAAELIIDTARRGLRIGEVPVTVLRRYSGKSKKGRDLSYGFNFSKTIIKAWLRK
jgi:cellulose synthase/poly-beta-1,6-N-acetylglucosamine synthase-like glycosyltransferase